MTQGTVLKRRPMGRTLLPVQGLLLMACKTDIRLPLEEISLIGRTVRKVTGQAVQPVYRLVPHCLAPGASHCVGMAFRAEFPGAFPHHVDKVAGMGGVALQTFPFSKWSMEAPARVRPCQILKLRMRLKLPL